MEEDLTPPKPKDIIVGEDVSRLSVEEIKERVALMRSEIERLELALARKEDSFAAANAAFKF